MTARSPRVMPVDLTSAPADAQSAAAAHQQRASLTNMKRTLLHAVPAFDALMSWYDLRDAIAPVIGVAIGVQAPYDAVEQSEASRRSYL